MFQQSNVLSKLTPWKTKSPEVYVRTLTLKVPTTAIERFGDVQGLISTVSDIRTGDVLSANIEETFADAAEQVFNSLPVNSTLERTFEAVIHRVNTMLSRLLGDGGLELAPGDIKGAIVAQQGQEVAAAVWGQPSLQLFRQAATGGSKIFDVLKTEADSSTTPLTAGLIGFTNLISGPIGPHDRMLVANRDLVELLGKMETLEIMSAARTDLVTSMLRDALLGRYDDLDLALLLLDGATATEYVRPSGATSRIVPKPIGLTTSFKKSSREPVSKTEQAIKLLKLTKSGLVILAKTSVVWSKRAVIIAKKVGRVTMDWSIKLANSLREYSKNKIEQLKGNNENKLLLANLSSDSRNNKSIRTNKISDGSKNGPNYTTKQSDKLTTIYPPGGGSDGGGRFGPAFAAWHSLNRRSKNLLVAAVVLLIIIALSLISLVWQRQSEKSTASLDKRIAVIRQQIDSAEASLIYRDEDRARRLLDEAMTAISELPDGSNDTTETKNSLLEEVRVKFSDLRRAISLDAPEVISAISVDGSAVDLRLVLDGDNGRLWSVSSDGKVFVVATDGSAEPIYSPEVSSTPIFLLPKNGGVLIGYANGQAVAVSTNGKVTKQNISKGDFEININQAATFGSRLYLLDSTHNRILRLASSSDGFNKPEIYVKDGTDLSNSISVAIDGYVFVLSSDGKITRLLSGKATDFTVDETDPPLSESKLLHTPSDRDDLYVLADERIVRFDKNSGRLTKQYESPELATTADFLVDQAKRQILTVNGNRILRFTWQEE
ncbi:hypothetical protein A2480_00630 [Candidatus Uhrbacteria bacterium RIFOXYC2_FULL_47_19]|uniref:PPM-type phosphatase domain-containing protein n=1 Tax=Candidatus Uhrbacteria bacterium RIFOXYC2_FULL_47_19 TaxID=1802424 RepID=A0A1F7WCV1_9BACT|nr:MAG: hypothetical protein A2480_00630 [Candidatus Uhrbacteria bacterium RIFOXYC2_FULL_47_19]